MSYIENYKIKKFSISFPTLYNAVIYTVPIIKKLKKFERLAHDTLITREAIKFKPFFDNSVLKRFETFEFLIKLFIRN